MSKFAKIVVSLISILLVSCLFMFSASAQSTDTMTVYVDQANGVDTNDGLSEASKEQLKDKTGEEIVEADLAGQVVF